MTNLVTCHPIRYPMQGHPSRTYIIEAATTRPLCDEKCLVSPSDSFLSQSLNCFDNAWGGDPSTEAMVNFPAKSIQYSKTASSASPIFVDR